MEAGWYQAAFERELHDELTAAEIGEVPLVLVRSPERLRAFDAACPHRGAHLAYGGKLDGAAIVCPFHGKRIQLEATGRYRVREHRVLGFGGMVFVGLGEHCDNGFAELLDKLAVSHLFLPGFTMTVAVTADWVIENAFDGSHFRPVHGIGNDPSLEVVAPEPGDELTLTARGIFLLPPSPWRRTGGEPAEVPFVAKAFSPHVVITEIGGEFPYTAITAATPRPGGGCRIWFSVAVPADGHESLPAERARRHYRYLLESSRAGIEQDVPVWEHLQPIEPDYDRADHTVIAFREFRAKFQAPRRPVDG